MGEAKSQQKYIAKTLVKNSRYSPESCHTWGTRGCSAPTTDSGRWLTDTPHCTQRRRTPPATVRTPERRPAATSHDQRREQRSLAARGTVPSPRPRAEQRCAAAAAPVAVAPAAAAIAAAPHSCGAVALSLLPRARCRCALRGTCAAAAAPSVAYLAATAPRVGAF